MTYADLTHTDALGTACRYFGDGEVVTISIPPGILRQELLMVSQMTDAELMAAARAARDAAREAVFQGVSR
jgi:hypothetical protein